MEGSRQLKYMQKFHDVSKSISRSWREPSIGSFEGRL